MTKRIGSVHTFPAQSDSDRTTWLFPEFHLPFSQWGETPDGSLQINELQRKIFNDILYVLENGNVRNLLLERAKNADSPVQRLKREVNTGKRRNKILRRRRDSYNMPNNDIVWRFIELVTDTSLDFNGRIDQILEMDLPGNIASATLVEAIMNGIDGFSINGFESAKTNRARAKRSMDFSSAATRLKSGVVRITHPHNGPQKLKTLIDASRDGDTASGQALHAAYESFSASFTTPFAELVLRSNNEGLHSLASCDGDSIIICGAFHAMDLARKASKRSTVHMHSYPELLDGVHAPHGHAVSLDMLDICQLDRATKHLFGL